MRRERRREGMWKEGRGGGCARPSSTRPFFFFPFPNTLPWIFIYPAQLMRDATANQCQLLTRAWTYRARASEEASQQPPPTMRAIGATLQSAAKFEYRVSANQGSREKPFTPTARVSQAPQSVVDHLVVGGGEQDALVDGRTASEYTS